MNFDVTVVGGGLVGSTLALALASRNIRVRLFDAQTPVVLRDTPDLRVVALNTRSINWLKEVGVWSLLDNERMGIFNSLCVEDHQSQLQCNAHDYAMNKLGVILENNHIVAKAQAACLAHPNIISHFSEKFQLDQADPRLVIAADGAQSQLRLTKNISSFSHDYKQRAHVCYVTLEKPHQHQAWQYFLPTGPIAFLPMHELNQASIVWTLPNDSSEPFTDEAITSASQYHYGMIKIASDVASFPLRLQLANDYFKDNIVFMGDAIHSIHPLAGQGVNLGFADAQVLVSILSSENPTHWTNPLLLKRYQRERLSPNCMMAHSMSAINTLFRQQNPWTVTARTWGMKQINRSSSLKNILLRMAGSI